MVATSLRLGLTGGIGSGKSTVSGFLEQMGAVVIDADAISRAATAPGGSAMAALEAMFGTALITADGALDRAQMRDLIFSDPSAKARLEAIVHPLVGQAIAQQALEAQISGARCTVFDIPLLVESRHWRTQLDRIMVIDCTEATQVARVKTRNGLSEQEVEKILATQASRTQRLACADCVLFNDGISLDDLRQHVQQIGAQFGL
ncbi:dephospho-CoA kinase [Rhodoferax sp. AJA081-3]|uniref:dephospho-CoA kinase n=1 Tax=Rhodoferax sp. AJA081-3 TaxID=2752316 RepID=UPI001ADF2CEE|nr:dephospho-CoA kinase [Rhodoferax sp. AJA081-3]QTN27724.1 dephospho-CoA kinase [Rhodoferax sp. AJA081-3]